MKWVLIVVVATAACKSKPTPNAEGSATPVAVAVEKPDAAVAPKKPAQPAKATPEQLAEAHGHMKAGWAAQKAKKWGDAVTEFEAALKIVDGDARALGELGWSAMNAGDLAKARTADETAVRAAIDPKVKAAGLFNLGLVEAKQGDKDAAKQAFTSSLVLRPNKTVEAELAKLGDAQGGGCPAGKSACWCVVAAEFGSESADTCAPSTMKSLVPGWKVFSFSDVRTTYDYLFDEHDKLVTAIAYEEEMRRSTGSGKLSKSEIRTIGGHKVAWLEVTSTENEQSLTDDGFTDEGVDQTTVTICAIGDAKTPTNCALKDAPRIYRSSFTLSELGGDAKVTNEHTTTDETVLAITLGDDGKIVVKVSKGKKTEMIPENVLGTHALW